MPSFSQTLTIKEVFETDAQLNKEVKRTEFNGAFCKIFQIVIDSFFHFFAKLRKSAEKTTKFHAPQNLICLVVMWISQFQYHQLRASHSLNILSHVLLTVSIFSRDCLLGSIFFPRPRKYKGFWVVVCSFRNDV